MPEEPHRQRHLPTNGCVASQYSPSTAAAPAVCGISTRGGKALPAGKAIAAADNTVVVVASYNEIQHGGSGGGEPERGENRDGLQERPSAAETDNSRRDPDEAELYRLGLEAAAGMDAAALRAEVDRFLGADQEQTPAQRRRRQQEVKDAPSFSYQLSDEQAWEDVKAVYDMVSDSAAAGGAKAGKRRGRR